MTDKFSTWQVVVPAKGRVSETAKALLALAQDHSLVRSISGGSEFLVPEWLAEKYVQPQPSEVSEEAPKPRQRRTRAKKEVI